MNTPRNNLRSNSRRSSALLTVIIFSTLMAFGLAALMSFGIDRRRSTARLVIYNAELAAAEEVLDRIVSQSNFIGQRRPRQYGRDANSMGDFTSNDLVLPTIEGFDTTMAVIPVYNDTQIIDQDVVDSVDPSLQQWVGYSMQVYSFDILAGARANSDSDLAMADVFKRPGVYVSRRATFFETPLMNYAIFYENTLEIDGGARIDVKGKVHTNDDWYLTTSSNVWYHDVSTSAGNFYGGIYNPLDGERRGWWSGTTDINITKAFPSGPGGTATQWEKIKQNTSVIPVNNGWLSSAIYNPGNPTGNPIFDKDTTPEDWWIEYPHWVDKSNQLFKGFLKDQAHGIEKVQIPIGDQESPYLLIEAPDLAADTGHDTKHNVNLGYQAAIVIETTGTGWANDSTLLDNVIAYRMVPDTSDPSGFHKEYFSLEITDPNDSSKKISFLDHTRIYNGRETKYVDLLDINVEKLGDYMKAVTDDGVNTGTDGLPTFNLTNPYLFNDGTKIDDGIIYVNNKPEYVNSTRMPGTRITNASDFSEIETYGGIQDFKGISVGTNAPLYTKGDVNSTANKIPLMLAGDSINLLSNAFKDSDYASSSGDGPKKTASNTTTNAVFVSGNVPTKYRQYGGGGENFFRYIENWGGKKHTYRGSILNLFESRIATTSWDKNTGTGVSSGYYGAPQRDWAWDPNFAAGSVPPGIPTSRQVSLGRWNLLSASEFASMGGTAFASN